MVCIRVAICAMGISLTKGAVLQVHKIISASGGVQNEEQNIVRDGGGSEEAVLGKMVWAQSERSVAETVAWKVRYLPVVDDSQTHWCGNNSRFVIENFTSGCTLFGLHAVNAAGIGGARSRTSGEISVEGIEDILDEVMDGETFSPWMDNHLAFYWYDLESLISQFRADGQKFVVLSWSADDMTFYSVIAHIPRSQETYEFISPQKPASAQEIVSFPTARHFFGGRFESLESDNRLLALHVSQTTRDLAYSVEFFKEVLGRDVVDQGTFEGGRYAIFNLTSNQETSSMDMRHGQVQLWERDDAKSGLHSPAWFEEYVENATLGSYNTSLTTCWNVWADNHFTINGVSSTYYAEVLARYKLLNLPYKEFSSIMDFDDPDADRVLFSGYFMLPGGRWFELHPRGVTIAAKGTELWDSNYCYVQSCGSGDVPFRQAE